MLGFILCALLNGTIYHDIHFNDKIVSRIDVPMQLGSCVVKIPIINNCIPNVKVTHHKDGTIQRVFTYDKKTPYKSVNKKELKPLVKPEKGNMKRPSQVKSENSLFPMYK